MNPSCRVRVTDEVLDSQAALEAVADPGGGAQILFVGVVRNLHAGKRVLAVTYDAFVPLAEKTLAQIAEEACTQCGRSEPAFRVFVEHRTGKLAVGEASVIIAIGSPHREAAYEASRYVIEQIKVRLPVWKKEHYESGDSEWLPGHSLNDAAPETR